jgi:4-aminobutyrate aminotransferase-like enzyme
VIAESFDNGMEFFSTFGGNNVSCAIGSKVLEVVQEEDLQAHALQVGERLLSGLRQLQQQHDIIADVRGSGLFLGVELLRNGAPATDEANRIVNRMREHAVLLGTDGPFHNVLKIRPPMPFSEADVDVLVSTLRGALRS